jgi:tetratricopeptide (TPR) repeat protein
LTTLERRIDDDLAAGHPAQLIGELEGLVRTHPLRERLRGQLMLSLYRSGRQAEALEAYQDARRTLTEELGIEPGRELRELQQAILNQDPALERAEERSLPSDGVRAPFVGRNRELEELLAGLDDAFAGRGRLFLLVGEPGIGKSRLAEELVAQARHRGARVLVGRCWEAGGAPAYWPWVQSLRAHVRDADPERLRSQLAGGAAELAQLLPELRELFPDLREPPALESESARFRLFEGASAFLRSIAETRPLVLVLDDLHAADEPSLLLLQFLARELVDSRLLVVAAYRDVDPTPTSPLTAAVTELARESATTSVPLAGLHKGDVARFVQLISGEEPSDELVAAIYDETEGNPLFVGEIVRLLAAEGDLDGSDGGRLLIPQSVRDVIGRRLRHLSEESNRVLTLASVLGREFGLDALSHLAAVAENELLDTLDEAMAARVVSDVPDSPRRLRFAHVLIRDALYDGLTTARRVRLHRLALEALEALYGEEPGAHLAELAYHSIAGSDFERGVRYAESAGDRALEFLAYEEAVRLYVTALEASDLALPKDPRSRCRLLLSLGEAHTSVGHGAAARAVFLEAADAARQLHLPRQLARAAAGYGGRIVFGRAGSDIRLVPLLEEGLAVLGHEDIELRARLLARLAGALRDEHSRDRRDRISREAVQLARDAGNLSALSYALDGRAAAINAPDTIEECLVLGTELCEVARSIGDAERVVYGHVHRFIAQLSLGDTAAAALDLEVAGRIADDLRQPQLRWQVGGGRAMVDLATGEFASAERLTTRALSFGERPHDWLAVPVYWLQRYLLEDLRGGDLAEFEPTMVEFAGRYPARSPFFRAVLAHLHSRLGRVAEAGAIVESLSAAEFSELPFDMEWLFTTSFLAEDVATIGDARAAAVLYRLLHPWRALNVMDMAEGIRGSVSRYVGLLAATTGRFDDAARHFEDALEANMRMRFPPWVALTQEDYGRMLIGNGNEVRGRALVERALATYSELGMHGPLRRAKATFG